MVALKLIVPNKTEKLTNTKAPVADKKAKQQQSLYCISSFNGIPLENRYSERRKSSLCTRTNPLSRINGPSIAAHSFQQPKSQMLFRAPAAQILPCSQSTHKGSIREMDHLPSLLCLQLELMNPFPNPRSCLLHSTPGDANTHKYLQLFVIHFTTILVSTISRNW